MIANIPFWKLWVENGEVKVVRMYKDKGGRKGVALGTDGSTKAKQALADILKNDLSRSYNEVSGPLWKFIQKNIPSNDLDQFKIPFEKAQKISDDDLIYDDEMDDGYHRWQ